MADNAEMGPEWDDFGEALRELWDHFHPGMRKPGEKIPYIDHVEADIFWPIPPTNGPTFRNEIEDG